MSSTAPIPPTLAAGLADRFPIERRLGEGGMATVYLARDVRHDRPVALKVLRPEVAVLLGRERFEQEIRVASSLSHPHILPVFDSGEAAGFLYYVMPVMEGESLAARIARDRFVGIDEAVRILSEVADALDFAHARGFVHRDIKPDNILLSGGHAQVADFGIALALSHVDGERLTTTGLSMGTPAYMSPEQAAGTRTVDGASDQYSLACTFYEMLGGDPPFTGSTPRSVMARHVADSPPPLATLRPGLPPGVELAVRRALSKIPVDRYPTCAAFAQAVRDAMTGAPVAPGRPAQLRRRPSPRAMLLAGAAALLLGTTWGVRHFRPRTVRIESIALLPPENGMGDSALQYRVEGVFERFVSALYMAKELRLKPRAAAERYWNRDHSLEAVARGLNADAVITSYIVPMPDSVRLTIRLVRAQSQELIGTIDTAVPWASADLASAAAAQAIASSAGGLSRADAQRIAYAHTVNPEALRLLQRAQFDQSASPQEKLTWLHQAIQKDHSYSDAYAQLAETMRLMMMNGFGSPAQYRDQALRAAHDAVLHDSSSARAWHTLALAEFWVNRDIDAAFSAGRKAVALGGRMDEGVLVLTGRFDEAIPIVDQAARNNPLSAEEALQPCWIRLNAHRYQEAIAACRAGLAGHPEDPAWFHFEASWAFAALGMGDSALTELEAARFPPLDSLTDIVVLGATPFVLAQGGRLAEARKVVARLAALSEAPEADPYPLGTAYAAIGEDSLAFVYLDRVNRERWPSAMFLCVEPELPARFRALPRFQELLRQIGFESSHCPFGPRPVT